MMSPEFRAWLDAELVKRGFGGYVDMEQKILAEHGVKIDHSTLHRYGEKLERKLAAIRASTEAARSIAEAAPDDADLRSAAVMSLVQTEIFDLLVKLQEASEEDVDQVTRVKLLSHVAKNIAAMSRASIHQKKWATEIRQQERERTAGLVDEMASAQGMDEAQAKFWREKFLGVK